MCPICILETGKEMHNYLSFLKSITKRVTSPRQTIVEVKTHLGLSRDIPLGPIVSERHWAHLCQRGIGLSINMSVLSLSLAQMEARSPNWSPDTGDTAPV